MTAHPLGAITDAEIDAFRRDGVICLRGLFDAEWVEHLRAAVEHDLAPFRGLRRSVETSPAAEIAVRTMRSHEANVLCDPLFVKAPGAAAKTHGTMTARTGPYRPVVAGAGPADPVDLVRARRRDGRAERGRSPQTFAPLGQRIPADPFGWRHRGLQGAARRNAARQRRPVERTRQHPQRGVRRHGAGDCRLHHGLTMHGAPGNAGSTRRRRAFATRWSGDAVVCAPHEGPARITIDEPACRVGEPIGCAVFPRLWPR